MVREGETIMQFITPGGGGGEQTGMLVGNFESSP